MCASLKKAFWKPQHKKSFFSPHKIHLSDKRTKLSNPPRSPTLDRKQEPTWLKNSWVDLNITKRVGKLKSTHKKEGQIFFCWATTTPTCENHCLLEFQLLLHTKTCHACSACVCEIVCVCMCVCLSLSPLLVSSLSEALPLLKSCVHVFCDKFFLLGQEEKQWGVWRGEQEEKWKMGKHPNCRNWKRDFNQKAFTFHNTNPIYRKAETLKRERERERERRRGWAIASYPIIQHTT